MTTHLTTDVLVVGGGPVGSLLATLLARRGVEVILVERQTELVRDFRGETLAAPSVDTLRTLGFGPALDAHGFLETSAISMRMEGREVFHLDYGRIGSGTLPIDIPQPALINAFNDAAEGLPGYQRIAGTNFTELLRDGDRIVGGVLTRRTGDPIHVRARLVVGADGRYSKVRAAAELTAVITPMQRDLHWFKLPRPADWGTDAQMAIDRDRHLMVLPTFPEWLRVGHNTPKGGLATARKAGLDAFKADLAGIDPNLKDLIGEHLTSWKQLSFLDIFTAELDRWTRDGLLLIGDAAHTCTPILGQGVNLGLQDAVTFAPVIATALRTGPAVVAESALLGQVAARRKHKAGVTKFQRMQEGNLAKAGRAEVAIRRLRFRALNALPLKYRVFGAVINIPHQIDERDLELAGTTAAVPTTLR